MIQKGCLPTVCVIGENQLPKIIKDLWERHIIDKYGLHYLSWSSADIPQSGLSNLQFKYTKGLCVCIIYLLMQTGSENDSPTMFMEGQLYIILVLAHGGYNLESYIFTNAEQSHSALIQVLSLYFQYFASVCVPFASPSSHAV